MDTEFDTLIQPDQLAPYLGKPGWCVFDCRFDLADTARGEAAHAAGHLPGAFYAHLDRDLSGPITPDSGRHPLPDPERLGTWLGVHGVDGETRVVAYDDSGGTMAVRLWWLLRWLGHRRVALLDGGWQAWLAAGMPVDTTAPAPARPRRFHGRPDPTLVVDSATLAGQVSTGRDELLVMDARTPERFRGDKEPIDPVAGRIPGAVNLPLGLNLGADGRFRPAGELRALYEPLLGRHRPDQVVAMCGSGVTACHNLLAMAIASLDGGRLYAGSWSEWIRDPARPVARG